MVKILKKRRRSEPLWRLEISSKKLTRILLCKRTLLLRIRMTRSEARRELLKLLLLVLSLKEDTSVFQRLVLDTMAGQSPRAGENEWRNSWRSSRFSISTILFSTTSENHLKEVQDQDPLLVVDHQPLLKANNKRTLLSQTIHSNRVQIRSRSRQILRSSLEKLHTLSRIRLKNHLSDKAMNKLKWNSRLSKFCPLPEIMSEGRSNEIMPIGDTENKERMNETRTKLSLLMRSLTHTVSIWKSRRGWNLIWRNWRLTFQRIWIPMLGRSYMLQEPFCMHSRMESRMKWHTCLQ